jgi:hypothetical protein
VRAVLVHAPINIVDLTGVSVDEQRRQHMLDYSTGTPHGFAAPARGAVCLADSIQSNIGQHTYDDAIGTVAVANASLAPDRQSRGVGFDVCDLHDGNRDIGRSTGPLRQRH